MARLLRWLRRLLADLWMGSSEPSTEELDSWLRRLYERDEH